MVAVGFGFQFGVGIDGVICRWLMREKSSRSGGVVNSGGGFKRGEGEEK